MQCIQPGKWKDQEAHMRRHGEGGDRVILHRVGKNFDILCAKLNSIHWPVESLNSRWK